MSKQSRNEEQGLKGHRCGEPLKVDCRGCHKEVPVIQPTMEDSLAYCNKCGEEEVIEDTGKSGWFWGLLR